MRTDDVSLDFVLKVASRCNLDCSYCYVYHKGDLSWRGRPALMSDETFDASLARIAEYCDRSNQPRVRITLHGGEPLLAGAKRFDRWCRKIYEALAGRGKIELIVQTNGTLLDEEWLDLLRRNQVSVGLSVDGPPEIHDRARVDHSGRGSYHRVARCCVLLRDAGVPLHLLTVITPGVDGIRTHRHLLTLSPTSINYLFPDYTHDTVSQVRVRHGRTPCADFLIPIFDDWWTHGSMELRICFFWTVARLILGGESEVDLLGNPPLRYVFVETDGAIEGLDVLRQCYPGAASTGLNVLQDGFHRILETRSAWRDVMVTGVPLPHACSRCEEQGTCGGGYLPHRYSTARGFDNASVWCADLLSIFRHIRNRLEVTPAETLLRRQALQDSFPYRAEGMPDLLVERAANA